MKLSLRLLATKPPVFLSLVGLKVEDFLTLCERLRPFWQTRIERRKKPSYGRKSNLESLEDKALAFLLYYRTHIMHEFLGYLFGLHNSNISRMFKKLEPLMAKVSVIKRQSRAQFKLGVMYEKGCGAKKSIAEAVKWRQLAAAQEHKDAQSRLKTLK